DRGVVISGAGGVVKEVIVPMQTDGTWTAIDWDNYSGEQFDTDLKLYYNRARYLNVSTGRFWSMDSFEGDPETPLALHKYLYSESNPIDRIDRSGHFSTAEIILVGAVLTVLATFTIFTFTVKPAESASTGRPISTGIAMCTERKTQPLDWTLRVSNKMRSMSWQKLLGHTVQVYSKGKRKAQEGTRSKSMTRWAQAVAALRALRRQTIVGSALTALFRTPHS